MKENIVFRLLRLISLGKYSTKLYFGNRNSEYSTITGGFITIAAGLILIFTSLTILIQTFERKNYMLTTTYTDLDHLKGDDSIDTLKMRDFRSSLLNFKYFISQYNNSKVDCSKKEIVVYAINEPLTEKIDLQKEGGIKKSFYFENSDNARKFSDIGIR